MKNDEYNVTKEAKEKPKDTYDKFSEAAAQAIFSARAALTKCRKQGITRSASRYSACFSGRRTLCH